MGIENGRIHLTDTTAGPHIIQGGASLTRLLIGSDEPDEIIRQADMHCMGDAAEIASVLFLNMHPMLSHWDEY